MSLSINYPFDNPNNYTYNADEIEISGGEQKLLDRRPPNSTFYASYTSDINGNWGDGVLTGTPIGGASTIGGRLYLAGNDLRYVDYDADLNADSQQTGCIRLNDLRTGYSGIPATTQNFVLLTKAAGDNDNAIWIKHLSGTGNLNTQIRDSAGNIIASITWGAWSPVAGTSYDIEINWDITTGATRLFINGVQFGATNTAVGTRDSNIALFRIGSDLNAGDTSFFTLGGILVFSTVQHTANYTPDWSNIYETIYSLANPTTIYNAIIRTDGLVSLTETSSKSGNDEIKYILRKDSIDYYHNGSAWVISDGTYSQSNTVTEVNTNAATFTTTPVNLQIVDFKHSDDGSTTPTLSNVEVTFDFAGESPVLTEVTIWSYLRNLDSPINGEVIKVRPVWIIGDSTIITGDFISQITNPEGYFEFVMSIEDVEPTFLEWNIKDKIYKTTFVNQPIVKFSELTVLWQNKTDIDYLGVT